MSKPSVPPGPSILGSSAFARTSTNYALSSDLAKLCLPSEYRDSDRVLAWVNSICFSFLLIGLVGLKSPKIVVKPSFQPPDIVPVVFSPIEENRKIQPESKQDESKLQDHPLDIPQVVAVVIADDPSTVAFAVPVVGAVVVKEARSASPPAPIAQAPPKPSKFDPDAATNGTFPPPSYPPLALRSHYQGTATIQMLVDESGKVTSAKVLKSSGYHSLDDAALQAVKTRWRFEPGPKRDLLWDCTFELK